MSGAVGLVVGSLVGSLVGPVDGVGSGVVVPGEVVGRLEPDVADGDDTGRRPPSVVTPSGRAAGGGPTA
ncbi:MAG TPA: hypothetical protein VK935_04015, partial [Actinomycetospora sp.]|nr:hypothetical protein [Actinomycetospora sp.]